MSFTRKIIIALVFSISVYSARILYFSSGESFGKDFTPHKPTVSSQHIPNTFSESKDYKAIHQGVERFLKKYDMAGASVAVAKEGKLVFTKGYGWADKEHAIKAQPYHLFRIASVSKLVTAVAIMKLVEDSVLSLDDQVFGLHGILNDPQFLSYKDPKVERITVRHLLSHTAGWTSRWGDPMFMPTVISQKLNKPYPIELEDIIQFMLSKRLHYPPGTMSSYSNLGYAILEKVIENSSGVDYMNYVQSNVLYPLGIFDMQIGGSYLDDRLEMEVKYYEPSDTYLVEDHLGGDLPVLRSYGGNDIKTLGAAGGWVASSTDLLKLMVAIDGFDTAKDILSIESIHEMVTVDVPGRSPLGWRGVKKNRYWYRTGTLAGTSALAVRRDDGISYVIIFNSSNWKGPELASDILDMMEKSISKIQEWPDRNLFDLEFAQMNKTRRSMVF